MDAVVPILAVVTFVVAWWRFTNWHSNGRIWSPLWGAFTTTAAAGLFGVAGALGYRLTGGIPFTVQSAWSDAVIWPQIWTALALAVVAAFLWRLGLESLRTAPQLQTRNARAAATRPHKL